MALFEQQDDWFFSRLATGKPSDLFGADRVVVEELSPGMKTLDDEWQRAKEWADNLFRERGETPDDKTRGRSIAAKMGATLFEALSEPVRALDGAATSLANTERAITTILETTPAGDTEEAERARMTQAAIDAGFISRRPGDGGDGIAMGNGEGSAYETLMQAEFAADRMEAEIRRITEAYNAVGEPVELDGLDGDLSGLREQIGEFKALLATIASKTGTFDIKDLQRLVLQMKQTVNSAEAKIRAADAALATNIGDIHNQLYDDLYESRIRSAGSQAAAESVFRDFLSGRYADKFGQRNVDAALDALRGAGVLSQDDFLRKHPKAAARLGGDTIEDIHRGGPAAEREIVRPLERRRELERSHPEEVKFSKEGLIGLGRRLKAMDPEMTELYRGIRSRSYESEHDEYFAVLPPLHTRELMRLFEEYDRLPESATEERKKIRESIKDRLMLAGAELAQAERPKQDAVGMTDEERALTAPGSAYSHPRERNAELQRLAIKKAEGGVLTPEETLRYDALRKATIVSSALAAEQINSAVSLAITQGRGQSSPILEKYYNGTSAERLTALQTLLRSQGKGELADRLNDPATQAVYIRALEASAAEIKRRETAGEKISEADRRLIQDREIQRTQQLEYISDALKGDKFFQQSAELLRQSGQRMKSVEMFVRDVMHNPKDYPGLISVIREYQQVSPAFTVTAQRLIMDLQNGMNEEEFVRRFRQDMERQGVQLGFEIKSGVLNHLKLVQPESYKLIADYIRSQGLDPDALTPAQMAKLNLSTGAAPLNEATMTALQSYDQMLRTAGGVSRVVEAFEIDQQRGGAVFNYINSLKKADGSPDVDRRIKELTEMGVLSSGDQAQERIARSVLSLPVDRQREILENLGRRDVHYQGGTVDHSLDRKYGAALLQLSMLPPEEQEKLKRNGMDFNDPDRARLRKQILENYDQIAKLTHGAALAARKAEEIVAARTPFIAGGAGLRRDLDPPPDEFTPRDQRDVIVENERRELLAGDYLRDIRSSAKVGRSEVRDGARAHFITLEQIRIGNTDRNLTEEQKLARATAAVDKVMRELESSGVASITAAEMNERLKAADAGAAVVTPLASPEARDAWIRQRVLDNPALAQARIPPMPSVVSTAIASEEAIKVARASGTGVARPPVDVAQAELLAQAVKAKVETLGKAAEQQITAMAVMMKLPEAKVQEFRQALARGDAAALEPFRAQLIKAMKENTGELLAANALTGADLAALSNPTANALAQNRIANELITSVVDVSRELAAARAEQQGRAAQLSVQRDPSLLAVAARLDAEIPAGPDRDAQLAAREEARKVVATAREQSIRDKMAEMARIEPAVAASDLAAAEQRRRSVASAEVDKEMTALRTRHEGRSALEALEREPAKLALSARSDDSFVDADRAAQLKARDEARELVMKAREELIRRRADDIAKTEPGLDSAGRQRKAVAAVDGELAERLARAQAPAGSTPDKAAQLKAQEQLASMVREAMARDRERPVAQQVKYQPPAELSGPESYARSEIAGRLALPRPADMARAEAALRRVQERPEDFSRFARPESRATEAELVLARQLVARRAILAESERGRGDPDYFQRLAHAGAEASEQLARGLRERIAGKEALIEVARRPDLLTLAKEDHARLPADRLAEARRAADIVRAAEHERELMVHAKTAELQAAPAYQGMKPQELERMASRAVDQEIARMASAGSGTTAVSIAGSARGVSYAALAIGSPANDALGRSAEQIAKEEEARRKKAEERAREERAKEEQRAREVAEKSKEVSQVVAAVHKPEPDKKPEVARGGEAGRPVAGRPTVVEPAPRLAMTGPPVAPVGRTTTVGPVDGSPGIPIKPREGAPTLHLTSEPSRTGERYPIPLGRDGRPIDLDLAREAAAAGRRAEPRGPIKHVADGSAVVPGSGGGPKIPGTGVSLS